jgi:hypothetical protein
LRTDTSRRRTRVLLAAAVALAGGVAEAWLAPAASAVPRYTARYEQKCALCHVNPAGGGMRTTYASRKLAPEEIAWLRAKPETLSELEGKLTKEVQIGADLRTFYVGGNTEPTHLNFFQMQSDLYVALQPDPRVTLYYDKGASNSYETFALGYLRPTLYLKAGRFIPSYGWKFDDHTMFVREELGFMPPANSDVGLEAGWSAGGFDVQAAVVNGSPGSTLDLDTKVAGVLNAVYRKRFGPVGAALGVSGYHQPTPSRDIDKGGLYGYATWNRFTWVGETDLVRRKEAGLDPVQSLVASHELTYLVRRGLEYDFYDPDRDLETGAKSRWGGGVFAMPYAYVAMEALVRRIDYDDGLAYGGQDFVETLLQLHLLY